MIISVNPTSPIILEQISIGNILDMKGPQELVINKDKSSIDGKIYIITLRKSLCEGLLDTIEKVLYYNEGIPSKGYIVDRYHSRLDYPKYEQAKEKLINANIYY